MTWAEGAFAWGTGGQAARKTDRTESCQHFSTEQAALREGEGHSTHQAGQQQQQQQGIGTVEPGEGHASG